jgi:hypothetical protein
MNIHKITNFLFENVESFSILGSKKLDMFQILKATRSN